MTAKGAPPAGAVHTLYVRDFPRDLTHQVKLLAMFRRVTIHQMLADLVRQALTPHRVYLESLAGSLADTPAAASTEPPS